MDRVFEAALAVSPKNRTQSVEAFWTALEDALQLPQSFAGRHSVASMPAVCERAKPLETILPVFRSASAKHTR